MSMPLAQPRCRLRSMLGEAELETVPSFHHGGRKSGHRGIAIRFGHMRCYGLVDSARVHLYNGAHVGIG